jgi:hypothetical protein
MSQKLPRFLLLQQCVPTMTLGHTGCRVPSKKETDRHGRAHEAIFAHARA